MSNNLKCDDRKNGGVVATGVSNALGTEFKNPYKVQSKLIEVSEDPRIQAEGKAGQSTDKGIIFVSESNFESEAGSEWVIGTCVKSPCVAAGNNELVSVYR